MFVFLFYFLQFIHLTSFFLKISLDTSQGITIKGEILELKTELNVDVSDTFNEF